MTDPVLRRREQLRTVAEVGQRVGYALFGLAMILFFVALVAEFPSGIVTAIVASMVIGSIVLAPTIVLGYAVKAADKEDAEKGHDPSGDPSGDSGGGVSSPE